MSDEEESEFRCIDCKFCKLPFWDRVGNWFGVKIATTDYKCNRTPTTTIYDHVRGHVTISLKNTASCYFEREASGEKRCGPRARYWQPKRKKDLFKLLQK